MTLIAAALMEELDLALGLCVRRARVVCPGARVLEAECRDTKLRFLKTGAGPRRAGTTLEMVLRSVRPSSILVIGYGGGLSRGLKLGDLAVLRSTALLGGDSDDPAAPEDARLGEVWQLAAGSSLLEIARSSGCAASLCDGLTAPGIIGDPVLKRSLHERFGVSVVDMETAALARVAAAHGIALGCVRALSDEADDEFLAPFTYDPETAPLRRAARVLASGNWIRRYSEWRSRSAAARESLRRFLTAYLSCGPEAGRS